MSDTSLGGRERAAPPAAEGTGKRTASGLALLGAAAGLGVLGKILVGVPPGIGIPLWIGAVLGAAVLLARRLGISLRSEGLALFLPALVFSAALAWRASTALAGLNVVGILLSLGLGAWWARSGSPARAGVLDYLRALLHAAGQAAVGPVLLAFGDIRWKGVASRGPSERAAVILRGILLASPLLFLFGALFVAADPIFERMLRDLFGGGWERAANNAVLVAVWTWLSAAFLRTTLLDRTAGRPFPRAAERRWSLDPLEGVVVLGLLGSLFLAFVLVQFRYLFGGAELVQEMAGMSFAEYARRGFFELVAVAVLLLPVLLSLDSLLAGEGERPPPAIRGLSLALVALLLVIIASAAERMRLYQTAYGLTEQRLYTTAFMGWLAVVFVWFAATVLRGGRERFAWGALLAGFATLGLLNLLDPDSLIARVNLQRAQEAERLDASYLIELSEDAVPVLAAALGGLPPRHACEIAVALVEKIRPPAPGVGWTSWNRSRSRAARLLGEREAELRRIACFREPPSPRGPRPAPAGPDRP